MADSAIEWTDKTWNPVTGCTRASAGCDNCYAVQMTKRLELMGKEKYRGLVNEGKRHFNGVVRCHEDTLLIPFGWKKPQRIFVNSMSDLFHKDVPFEFIDRVFAVMALCPQHTFQVLTKRPERMAEYLSAGIDELWARWVHEMDPNRRPAPAPAAAYGSSAWSRYCFRNEHPWPLPNIWLGTSVEDQVAADLRREPLRKVADLGWLTWVSNEPAIDAVCWDYWDFIRWMVTGGESGPEARPSSPNWHRYTRDWCLAMGIPFLFKQWGAWLPGHHFTDELHDRDPAPEQSRFECAQWLDDEWHLGYPLAQDVEDGNAMYRVGKKAAGRLLDGREWNGFPGGAR